MERSPRRRPSRCWRSAGGGGAGRSELRFTAGRRGAQIPRSCSFFEPRTSGGGPSTRHRRAAGGCGCVTVRRKEELAGITCRRSHVCALAPHLSRGPQTTAGKIPEAPLARRPAYRRSDGAGKTPVVQVTHKTFSCSKELRYKVHRVSQAPEFGFSNPAASTPEATLWFVRNLLQKGLATPSGYVVAVFAMRYLR